MTTNSQTGPVLNVENVDKGEILAPSVLLSRKVHNLKFMHVFILGVFYKWQLTMSNPKPEEDERHRKVCVGQR